MADTDGGSGSKDKEEKKEEKKEEVDPPRTKKRGRPPRKVEGGSASASAKAPALFCVGDRVLLKSFIGVSEGDENLDGYFIATITELTQKESGDVLYCLRKVDGSVLEDVVEDLITKSVQM